MTPLQLELTNLIGKKELTFGCRIKRGNMPANIIGIDLDMNMVSVTVHSGNHNWWKIDDVEIIGHPATLSDLHRGLRKRNISFKQDRGVMICFKEGTSQFDVHERIKYDCEKDFLDQDESTLIQIRDLILSNQ